MAGLLLWLARNNRRDMIGLFVIGGAFVIGIALFALADPQWFELVIRSVFLDTTNIMPRLTLAQRFLEVERLALVGMIMTGLVAAVIVLRRDRSDVKAQIIAAACAMQMALLFVDPLPYGYVFSWALIPTLAGLVIAARMIGGRALAWGAFASVTLMLALSAAYALRKGPPPVGHYTRLTLGDQIPENTIRGASTPDLVAFTMTQSAPWNQLAARGELCRRITGRAATHFWYQPICLPDAMYNWIGQTWTDAELTRLTDERPPQLIVWGNARTWPLDSLAGYSVYSGFAIRADQRDRQGTSQTKD